jgi:hypothetical protein
MLARGGSRSYDSVPFPSLAMPPSYATAWTRLEPMSPTSPPSPSPTMGVRAFIGCIGLSTLLGFMVCAIGAVVAHRAGGPWWLSLAAIPVALAGFEVTSRTVAWVGSLAGHLLASAAFGVVLAPVVMGPAAGWLRESCALVMVGTAVMAVGGVVHPAVLRRFGTFLLAIVAAVVLERAAGRAWSTAIHGSAPGYAGSATVGLMVLYVNYFWARSLALPHVLDNAVDTACALYLDIVNRAIAVLDYYVNWRRPWQSVTDPRRMSGR